MLSDMRKRQKWSLNPRGNLWAQDDSKVGQKLMEKMGWSKGKGLGKSEQGDVDHITVQFKDREDVKGVGFEGHDGTWIAHQDEFAAVLAALNETHGSGAGKDSKQEDNVDGADEVAPASLENKSKKLKKRVHYHKFTRGKDLSRYSSKDLDCILGSDAVKKKRKEEEEANSKLSSAQQSGDEGEDTSAVGEVVKSHGLVTISGGSINDYFAKKMADKKKAWATSGGQLDQVFIDSLETVKGRKKKSKEGEDATETEVGVVKFENVEESSDTSHTRTKSKKKQKKAKQIKEDPSVTVGACENVEEVQNNSSRIGKKKRSEKDVEPAVTESADLQAPKSKKDKKKKHKPTDVGNDTEVAPEMEGASSKSKKKRKADNEISLEDSTVNQVSCNGEVKKKKRKKSSEEADVESADVEKSQKGKKRKKMAEEVEHIEEAVSKPKKNRKQEKLSTVPEVITNKSVKNKKGDKMRLLRNSAKDCGFKGSNLGAIKSYGSAA